MADFNGTSGADIFTGGLDNDNAYGNGGNDNLSGGGGTDLLVGGDGADTLNGGDGDDNLYSYTVDPNFPVPGWLTPAGISYDVYAQRDTLNGGNGDDYIFAGYGDNVDGGAQGSYGNRLYISFMGASTGVQADFRILQSTGSITIGGGTITNIQTIGYLEGSNYDDLLVPIDTYYPTGADVFGRGGNDQIIAGYYSGWGSGALYGGDGDDIIDGRPAQYGPRLYGDAGNDTIYGNTSCTIYGGDGNDTIYGAATVDGGAGADTIVMSSGYYSQDRVTGGAGNDNITTSSAYGDVIAGGAGADNITGSSAGDVLGAADFVDANSYQIADDLGSEHDSISAGGGDDHIIAGYGDNVDGGAGTDVLRLSLAGSAAGVTLSTKGIASGSPFALGGGTIQNVETLEYLRATNFADKITAATQASLLTIDAGAGNDLVISQSSSVEVFGGAGNDRLVSGPAGDIFHGGDGVDTVDYQKATAGVTVALSSDPGTAGTGGGGDQLFEVENVYGSAYSDHLTGNDGNNLLRGQAGNDYLYGGAGNDTLDGGAGDDRMYGGLGDDTYIVNDATDYAIENSGEGIDTVKSSISIALRNNVENLVLTGSSALDGTGNGLANTITGNSGDNTLLGLGGNDFLNGHGGHDHLDGGEGSDTYYIGSFTDYADAQIADTGSAGWDILRFAGTSAGTLVLGVGTGIDEVDVATNVGATANFGGTTAINVDASASTSGVIIRGNSGANTLTGTGTNDNLYGNYGNDHLIGGDGNDVLDGGRGSDVMDGGLGADLYYVDSASDSVIEAPDGGNDAVYSSISYTLGSDVENLRLLGTNNLNGTGNELNNTLDGNSAANTLSGLGGDDFIDGGAGNDTLQGGDGADWIIGGAGRDSMTGGAGIDTFVFHDGDFGGATTSTADRIIDFTTGEDKMDLNTVDANTLVAGDQSFAFVGTNAFSHTAGELRYEQISGNTYVEGDTNGDGIADFMIRLDGLHVLTGTDIVP